MCRRNRLIAVSATLAMAMSGAAIAADTEQDFHGRILSQLQATYFPENSLFRDLTGSAALDAVVVPRLLYRMRHGRWDVRVDYEFIALYGDRVEYSRDFPEALQVLFGRLPNDRRRLFDLTWVLEDDGKVAVLNRLDRLAVGYTSEKVVARFGRQAISWGNGLLYTTMDIFNPFDPAAVDKVFKTGDDMLYGQYLRNNGDDVQGVMVIRRDLVTGDVDADVGSLAFKYHGISGSGEFDGLVARHYGDTLVGAGGNHAVGGAMWRGDLVVTLAEDRTVASLVTSLWYSWMWGGKNVSGVLEYFHNGFGQGDGCYSPDCLAENPELLERISRGELFTLGRDYLAVSAMFEVTPLFRLTPNLFTNLRDPSALLQVLFQDDLTEDLILTTAINLPIGADGTEFGGIDSSIPGRYLSSGPGILLQLAWYF